MLLWEMGKIRQTARLFIMRNGWTWRRTSRPFGLRSTFLLLISAIFIFFGASCAARQKPRLNADPNFKASEDRSYLYYQREDGSIVLIDRGNGLDKARKDLGCPCTLDREGVLYILTPYGAQKAPTKGK